MDNTYKFVGTGLTTKEKKWGCRRFKDYQDKYHIDTLSDLQLLEELTFREAIQERYKEKIETLENAVKKNDSGEIVPKHILYALDENLKNIIEIKSRLGLFEHKKEEDDAFKAFEILKKKFKIWQEENQTSREFACPHCSQMIWLCIKTEFWEAKKYPYLKDKILYNKHLVDLYLDNKITKEDVSKILGCSDDYVQWMINKWHQRKDIENNEKI